MTAALALLMALPIAAPDTTALACPGGQTVTRTAIEADGAVYFSDVLRLFDTVRLTSVDGFSWQSFYGSGSPVDGGGLTVLLDGEPVALDLVGTQDVELVPVPIGAIERVVWCPMARLAAGQWAGRGVLHIETVGPPSPGTTARGALYIGNETGDPGPYRYTDLATPNVDKFGPDAEGRLAYRDDRVAGRLDLRYLRFYATDPAALQRNLAATTRLTANQRVMAAALRGHELTGHLSLAASGRYVSDLWFFEPAGRELPVRRLDAHLSAHGRLLTGRVLRVRYRLAFDTQHFADEDRELPDFHVDWYHRALAAGLEAEVGAPGRAWTVSAAVAHHTAAGMGLGDGADLTRATLGVRRIHVPRVGFGHRTDLALVTTRDAVRAKAAQAFSYGLGPGHLVLTLVAEGRLPEESPSYGYWVGRGFSGLNGNDVRYRALQPPMPGTEASARLAWRGRLGTGVHAGGHVAARATRDLYVERPSFRLEPGAVAVQGEVVGVPDARGETLEAHLALDGQQGAWHARGFYSLLRALRGTDAFRAAWERVPEHRAGLALTLRPDARFSLRAALTAESATRWPGYAALDGAAAPNGYVYTDGTPTRFLFDASVAKRLWEERLRVSLQFRNLLNAEERYHPLGAALDFRLLARVEARLHAPLRRARP